MIRRLPPPLILLLVLVLPPGTRAPAAAGAGPTIDQFLSAPYPQDLVAAKKADRIAWWSYERGRRNVYTAAAPDFKPVRLTEFTEDNFIDISDVGIADDGRVLTFVRGTQPNRLGWIANPTSDARGADRTIWAVRTTGGAPWKLGEGSTPALSPDGRMVVFAKDGQIFSYRVASGTPTQAAATLPARAATPVPLIKA